MKIGDALPPRTLTIRAAPMRVLAEVLRDPNPIHLDPKAVAAAGLGDRVINQGPANLAYVIDMLARAFPQHRLAGIECAFRANIRDGDQATAGGTITAIDGDRIHCDTWLKLDDATIALTARVTLTPR